MRKVYRIMVNKLEGVKRFREAGVDHRIILM
jgi:hypothetical protein